MFQKGKNSILRNQNRKHKQPPSSGGIGVEDAYVWINQDRLQCMYFNKLLPDKKSQDLKSPNTVGYTEDVINLKRCCS